MTQPEALRLADALMEPVVLDEHAMQAAAELRRLHAEVEALLTDAKRYRWLRDTLHSAVGGGVTVNDERLVYQTPEPGEEVRVYWYPDTPVGFYESKAATLDEAVDSARGEA
jgi:hypothetical protein